MRGGFATWFPQFATFSFSYNGEGDFRRRIAQILTTNLAIPANISVLEEIRATESSNLSFGIFQ